MDSETVDERHPRWKPVTWADGCCGEGDVRTVATEDGAYDGDEARCTACGRPGTVSADEDGAHINWHDEPDCKCWWCTREREDASLRAQLAERESEILQGQPFQVGSMKWVRERIADLTAQLATAQAELARVTAERDGARVAMARVQVVIKEIRTFWSFDNDQRHTHSWHDRESFIKMLSIAHPTPEGKP